MVGLIECEHVLRRIWASDHRDGLLHGLLLTTSHHWDLRRVVSKTKGDPIRGTWHLRELRRVIVTVKNNIHKSG